MKAWRTTSAGRLSPSRRSDTKLWQLSRGCCRTGYSPGREFGIHPLDPALDLPWPADLELGLSAKDTTAPTLAEARAQGLLPTLEQCTARYAELRALAAAHPPC